MANKKAQNSILVLTTLGVYLGLLMVGGAAPQVLAHSATTRNFEITDEIEVKDDLDTNPDDERSDERLDVRLSLLTYFQDVEYFVKTPAANFFQTKSGSKRFSLCDGATVHCLQEKIQ